MYLCEGQGLGLCQCQGQNLLEVINNARELIVPKAFCLKTSKWIIFWRSQLSNSMSIQF